MVSDFEGQGADSARNAPSHAPAIHPLIATALFCAIYLQRFGLHTASGAFISAGHIIVLVVCFALLVLRKAVVDLWLLLLLAGFLAYALLLSMAAVTWTQIGTEIAPQSLFLLVTLYAVLCFVPVPLDDTRSVLFVYNRHMLLLGILGVLQFAVQFIGIKTFSFRSIVPDIFLIEYAYNVVIPLNYNSEYYKSNGVFFLEPSLFSQFIAVALAAEMLLFRRPLYISVYCMAIFASYSGSGLLTLATALAIMSIIRPRYSVFLIALVLIGAAALSALSLVAPHVYTYYVARALEVQSSGSSGHLRYVTPYLLFGEVSRGAALIFGYGPGTAEKFQIGFGYTVNALIKIVVEYGVIGAALFFGFLCTALNRRGVGAFLIVLCMSWYFLGGGYQLTSCVVHTMAAFLVWSSWTPEARP